MCCSCAAHFTAHNAVLAGHSLAAFAIGLPVFALVKILTPGFFGRGDTMTPLKIGVLAVALNLGMNLVFMHPLKAVGPALATSLSSACNAVLLVLILRRRGHFTFDALAKRRIPRLLLAGAVMAAALYGTELLLPPGKTSIPEFLLLTAGRRGRLFRLRVSDPRLRHGGDFGAAAPPAAQGHGRLTGAENRRNTLPWHAFFPAFSPRASPLSAIISARSATGSPCRTGDDECVFCLVDLHAITVFQEPAALREQTRQMAAVLLACGIDPERSILFHQSAVSAHARLAWIFNCVARIGWLNRMTQFKDKAGKDREAVSTGLYVYPNLMAADIHAYHATKVPVGDDQLQHLELANDIAEKFNHDFSTAFFPRIEPLVLKESARVMSLRDGAKKMSKSDPSDQSRINLTDGADMIAAKIRRAKTDPDAAARACPRPRGTPRSAQPHRHLRRHHRAEAARGPAPFRRLRLRPLQGKTRRRADRPSRADRRENPRISRRPHRPGPHPASRRTPRRRHCRTDRGRGGAAGRVPAARLRRREGCFL